MCFCAGARDVGPRLFGRSMIGADGETANVRVVCGFERPSIERLLQFYIYDFSELETPDSDDLEFDDQDGMTVRYLLPRK